MSNNLINIAQLDIDTELVKKKSGDLKKNIIDLEIQMRDLKKSTNNLSTATDEEVEQFVDLERQLKSTRSEYSKNQKDLTSFLEIQQQEITTHDNAVKSNRQLKQERQLLFKQVDEIKGNTKVEIELREKLNGMIDQHTEALNNNSSEEAKRIQGIGQYENAINNALGKVEIFNTDLGELAKKWHSVRSEVQENKEALKAETIVKEGSTKATNLGSIALKRFKYALASTGIGLIIIALGALVSGFLSTQRGMDSVTKITRPLKEILDSLWGVIQDLSTGFVDMAKNPKQAFTDLLDFIKNNVMNRFKAFSVVLEGIQEMDFKKIGNGLLQGATGVENVIDKVNNASKSTGDFMKEAYNRGLKLDELQKQIERSEINLIEYRAKQKEIIKEQNKIAEDVTKTEAERIEAAEKANQASKDLLKAETKILDLKIQQKKLSFEANDTSREDEKELAELQAQRHEKRTQQLEVQTTITNKLNTIQKSVEAKRKKAEEERLKQVETETNKALKESELRLKIYIAENKNKAKTLKSQLDFVKNIYDQELEIIEQKNKAGKLSESEYKLAKLNAHNSYLAEQSAITNNYAQKEIALEKDKLQKIADEKALLKEREVLEFENNLELKIQQGESEFEIQQQILERDYQAKIEHAQKLGANTESIAKVHAEKLKHIEQVRDQARLKETSTMFGNISKLLGEQTVAGKAAGIAQATINTWQGVTEVWKTPSTLPEPFATISKGANTGVVLASGLGAVKEISKVKTSIPRKYTGGKIEQTKPGRLLNSQNVPTQEGGDNVLIFAKRGELILNEQQERNAKLLYGSDVFHKIGVPGFYSGGYPGQQSTSYNQVTVNNNNEGITEAVKEGFHQTKLVIPVERITEIQNQIIEIKSGADV